MTHFEIFYEVASRCGFQFSTLCNENEFVYQETRLLWDLLNLDPSYVLDQYLSYQNMMDRLFMYSDHDASSQAYLNSKTDYDYNPLYEKYKQENADKFYKLFADYCFNNA